MTGRGSDIGVEHTPTAAKQQRARKSSTTDVVGPNDHVEAARLADYGPSPGWVGALFYLLYVPKRRRVLRDLLRKAERERDRIFDEVEWAYLECGRRIHRRGNEP